MADAQQRKDILRRVQAKLEELSSKRAEVLSKIDDVVLNTDDIEAQRDILDDIADHQLPRARENVVSLAHAIKDISVVSHNSCSRVQQYDTMNERVQDALRIVEDMRSHKDSLSEINAALTVCDYEKAAELAQKCAQLKLKYAGVSCFEEDIDPQAVDAAIAKVQDSLREELAAALRRTDVDMVLRFTRLFPNVGLRHEGCDKYIQFVRELAQKELAEHVDKSLKEIDSGKQSVTHLLLVSQILDHVVSIMEREEQNVDEVFGAAEGSESGMKQMLLELHAECTTHCVNVLTAYQKGAAAKKEKTSSSGNVKLMDRTLEEISELTSCCHMYLTYVDARLRKEEFHGTTPVRQQFSAALTDTKLTSSKFFDKVQELLSMYIPLQREYFHEVCTTALQADDGSGALYLDDVFYIFRVAARRVMSTQNVMIVCSVINLMNDVLRDRVMSEATTCLVLRNDNSVGKKAMGWSNTTARAEEYIIKLINEIVECAEETFAGRSADITMCTEHTTDLRTTGEHMRALVASYLEEVSASVVIPAMLEKAPLTDLSKTSYVLGEATFVRFETNDPWAMLALSAWDGVLNPYRRHLHEDLFAQLLVYVAKNLCGQIESIVVRKTYDAYGGLQIDKDIRNVRQFFCDRSTLPMRETFMRLTLITNLLVVERVQEVVEYFRTVDVESYPLTASDVKSVLSCRNDFTKDQIKKLKLPL